MLDVNLRITRPFVSAGMDLKVIHSQGVIISTSVLTILADVELAAPTSEVPSDVTVHSELLEMLSMKDVVLLSNVSEIQTVPTRPTVAKKIMSPNVRMYAKNLVINAAPIQTVKLSTTRLFVNADLDTKAILLTSSLAADLKSSPARITEDAHKELTAQEDIADVSIYFYCINLVLF